MTLKEWCRSNWDKLPDLVRKDCVDHLDAVISTEVKIRWKHQGYDRPGFHMFYGGMAVRNFLREQLTDGELPEVTVDHEGKPYGPSKNWDDYYTGAIDELLERY